jgi:putative PIN family toxin of toxin-antitoxin system
MKIVIDTNDYISALIGKKHRDKLKKIFLDDSIEIFANESLLTEIKEVSHREKIRKYVSLENIDFFIQIVRFRVTLVDVKSEVHICNDSDDNFLLALCIDSGADFLITGDKKDLLSLKQTHGVNIIRMDDLSAILEKGRKA